MERKNDNVELEAAKIAVRRSDPDKTEGRELVATFATFATSFDHVEVEAQSAQFVYRWSVYIREIRDAHERVVELERRVVDRGYHIDDSLLTRGEDLG